MGTTPVYAFRYPASTDSPNGPVQVANLATDLEAKIILMDAILNAAPIGGEYRAAGTQTMAATSATKMTFGTAIQVANGITWNGSNQFTVVTPGVYNMYATGAIGFVGGSSWGIGIHDSVGAPAGATPWISSPIFAAGNTDSFTMSTRYLTAGQTLCAWFYNNDAATRTLNSGKFAEFRVWRSRAA